MPLAERYDAALCDLDGVLYLGDDPVPHAAAAVAAARAAGQRFAFVTNNASRAPATVAERLTRLGMPAEPGDVVTSGQAAGRTLAERLSPGSTVLVVGTEALADEVRAVWMRPVRTVAEAGPDGPDAVVQGLAPATSWSDLSEAAVALHGGALWVAGNTDLTLPTSRGQLPGNGAFVEVLVRITGRQPLVSGKPDPALHRVSVERVGAERPLVVGDRLDTDVLGAVRGDADSLLVLTGVTDVSTLLAAPLGSRPTFVGRDLRSLLRAHPQVEVEGESARCGAAVALVDADGSLRCDALGSSASARSAGGHEDYGDGGDDDALRALASLAWSLTDAGRSWSWDDGAR